MDKIMYLLTSCKCYYTACKISDNNPNKEKL